MIPGITTDYGATQLSCDKAGLTGIENFVGGVSNGEIGISVMRYTNPLTKSLYWQKVWFFLKNDVQFTMISNITSTSGHLLSLSLISDAATALFSSTMARSFWQRPSLSLIPPAFGTVMWATCSLSSLTVIFFILTLGRGREIGLLSVSQPNLL